MIEQAHSRPFGSPLQLENCMFSKVLCIVHNGHLRELKFSLFWRNWLTMTFDPTDPTVAVLMREVERAGARGVHINLGIDAHSFLLNPAHFPGPLFMRRSMPDYAQERGSQVSIPGPS